MSVLEDYSPRNNKYTEAKNKLLNNVNKFYKGRKKITEGFKSRIFPFNYDEAYEERMRFERQEEERLNNIKDKNGLIDYKRLNRLINAKEKDINNELVSKHFLVQDYESLLEKLGRTKKKWFRKKYNSGKFDQ